MRNADVLVLKPCYGLAVQSTFQLYNCLQNLLPDIGMVETQLPY